MVGVKQGVALNNVGDGVNQVVQNQIQAQQAGGFLRDVLRVDCAAPLADGVGNIHEERAGACRGVVAAYIAHLAALGFWHEDGGHDLGDGVRGVVLGVFAAAVLVVVLDEVFKQGGVEVIFLREDALEAELHQFIDDGAAEVVALGGVGDVFAHAVEQSDLGPAFGLYREDVVVTDGDVAQGVVEEFGELRRVLAAEQMGDEVLGFQAGGVRPHLQLQHFPFFGTQLGNGLFPACALSQFGLDFLGLKGEFVVEEFVEKDLGDDLEFVAIIAEAVVGADRLEVVDQLPGALFKFLRYQGCAPVWGPVREPAENSFMYSFTTSRLMVWDASGSSWIFWRV